MKKHILTIAILLSTQITFGQSDIKAIKVTGTGTDTTKLSARIAKTFRYAQSVNDTTFRLISEDFSDTAKFTFSIPSDFVKSITANASGDTLIVIKNDLTNKIAIKGSGGGSFDSIAPLKIIQKTSGVRGLNIFGQGFFSGSPSDTTKGITLGLGYNSTDNQAIIGNSTSFGSSTSGLIRFTTGMPGYSRIDAVRGDNLQNLLTILGTSTSNVGITASNVIDTLDFTAKFTVSGLTGNNVAAFKTTYGQTIIDQYGSLYSLGTNPSAGVSGTGTSSFIIKNTASQDWRIENTRNGTAGNLEFNVMSDAGNSKVSITPTGQVAFGSNSHLASSKFTVTSTTQGTIPFPVMTATQKIAISSPAIGVHIYQSDGTEGVYVYKSSGWAFAY
jgi:hypothetical protein